MAIPVSSICVNVATLSWSVVVTKFVGLVVSDSGSVTPSLPVVEIPAVVLSSPVGENTRNMLCYHFEVVFKVNYIKLRLKSLHNNP